MNDDRYSRLYHKVEREFPDVYADTLAFGWWAKLLMIADAAWPTLAPVPRSVPDRVLRLLTESSLVVIHGDRYDIRGLSAERQRRHDRAAAGGRARAERKQSDSTATAAPVAVPRTRREENEKREKLTENVEVTEARPPDPVQPKNERPRCETCGHRKVSLGDGRFVCTHPHRPASVSA